MVVPHHHVRVQPHRYGAHTLVQTHRHCRVVRDGREGVLGGQAVVVRFGGLPQQIVGHYVVVTLDHYWHTCLV